MGGKKAMREIKFRAWDGEKMIWPEYLNLWKQSAHWTENSIPTQSGVLMQWTGLKDKKRVEIYEGDILRHDIWGDSLIVWEDGGYRGAGNDHDITLAHHQVKRSKVVGNMYENRGLVPRAWARFSPPLT